MQYAGVWIRLHAIIIDLIILAALDAIISSFNLGIELYYLRDIFILGYFIIMPTFYEGTIGKKICNIKIINKNGKYISLTQSMIRFLPFIITIFLNNYQFYLISNSDSFIINILIIFYYLAEISSLKDSSSKQSLHDKLAKTYVINK